MTCKVPVPWHLWSLMTTKFKFDFANTYRLYIRSVQKEDCAVSQDFCVLTPLKRGVLFCRREVIMDNKTASSQRAHSNIKTHLKQTLIPTHLFNQTAYVYKKDHAHSIHNPHMKMYFHSHPDGMPADGYQHVSTLVSCKHSHLHKSGSFFQFLLQLKVFQYNKGANEKDCLQDSLVNSDHKERISCPGALYWQGSKKTGHISLGQLDWSIQFTLSYQSNTAARKQQLKISVKIRRAWDCTSSSPTTPRLLLRPVGTTTAHHTVI